MSLLDELLRTHSMLTLGSSSVCLRAYNEIQRLNKLRQKDKKELAAIRTELDDTNAKLADSDVQVHWFVKRCDWYNDKLGVAERALDAADKAVPFFASVIKSGESWSGQCEEAAQQYYEARAAATEANQ